MPQFRKTMPLVVLSLLIASPAQAQFAEFLRQMGQSYSGWSDSMQKTGCTLPVWHMGKPQRVFLVPPGAVQYGLEAGDYLISIDKKRVPLESEKLNDFLTEIPGDATVSITVFRDGEFEVVSADCRPAAVFATTVAELADSLLSADPDGCLASLDEFEQNALGSLSASMTETRHRCQMIATPNEFRENQAGYLYVHTEQFIDEMKYFPWFPTLTDDIRARIETIEALGETDLATTLTHKLEDASDFADQDGPPPEIF